MKKRISEIFNCSTFASCKRLLVIVVIGLCLLPATARAAGIGDILTLFQTITSTIQGAIGGALSGIQTLNSTINNFRQQIIWPVAAINQAKASVTSTIAQYSSLMSQFRPSITTAQPSPIHRSWNRYSGAARRGRLPGFR